MEQAPEDYEVMCFCTACGRDFAGDTYFDRHRIGVHDYTYREGLSMSPPREDGRRCMTPEEMTSKKVGMRRMTDEEMRAGNHRRRVGFGVEMWFDPVKAERMRALRERV